jgi:hypothetical protein
VSFESAVYRLVDEPANPNCVANCVRPLKGCDHLRGSAAFDPAIAPSADASSISRCWPASIVHLNRPEAAREDRVDSICLAQRPVRLVLKSRFTERVVERGLPISDRRNIRANLLRLPRGLGPRKQPPNSRLLQPLKSLTFKATPLCLLASFLFDNFRFPLDHPAPARSIGSLQRRLHGNNLRAWGWPSRSNLHRHEVELAVKAAGYAVRAQPPLACR